MSKDIVCQCREIKTRDKWSSQLFRRHLDGGCLECYFLKTHRAEFWLNDWAKCTVGRPVQYGDKIKFTPARIEVEAVEAQ